MLSPILSFLSVISVVFYYFYYSNSFLFLVEPTTSAATSCIGEIDMQVITAHVTSPKNVKRQPQYHRWTEKERYDIGKYAAENGNINTVRKFNPEFPSLSESTVRSFKKKYYEQLREKSKEELDKSQTIPRYSQKTGRPLLLCELDEMVRKYPLTLSKRGGVINTTVANATAKALMSKYPHVLGQIDVDSSRWAKSLFSRMNFVKRRKTSSKVDIPDGARKEIEFLFLHEIVSIVEKYKIPPALINSIDQTPLKYVPVGNETLAPRGETSVTIEGSADKRSITGTFAISLHGEFLPMQLIYGGKTSQSLPRFEFPSGFLLSANSKHFSNTDESLKCLKEIIKPYVKKQRELLKCSVDQKALVIMDVFTGQMTTAVLDAFKEADICIVNVPANMTKYYQPLDLTVNGYAKRYLKRKFIEWYSGQVNLTKMFNLTKM